MDLVDLQSLDGGRGLIGLLVLEEGVNLAAWCSSVHGKKSTRFRVPLELEFNDPSAELGDASGVLDGNCTLAADFLDLEGGGVGGRAESNIVESLGGSRIELRKQSCQATTRLYVE